MLLNCIKNELAILAHLLMRRIYDKATKVISTKLNTRHTYTFIIGYGFNQWLMPSYFIPIILLL